MLTRVNKSNFSRWAGVIIALAVVVAAALLMFAVATKIQVDAGVTSRGTLFGLWSVLYDSEAPEEGTMYTAIALALLMAAGIAIVERRIATRYRRSGDIEATPLAPKLVMAETRGVFAGPVTITVLIPAHNEESLLRARSTRCFRSRTRRTASSSWPTTAPTDRAYRRASAASRSSPRSATPRRRRGPEPGALDRSCPT